MAEKTICVSQPQTKAIKILKWKVSEGNTVSIGRIILLYDFDGVAKAEQRKLKVTQAGTIQKIVAQEGAIVNQGEPLCVLTECSHPTIMNDMCAECGTDLRKNETTATASVPMVHTIPDLKVSEEVAQKLGRADSERLIKDRKLVLLVDLDQTLIHTTNDNVQPNIKDVYHFRLYGPHSPCYHTRLRPGTLQFLENVHPYFELHICTFGARNYAHMIAAFLDRDQKFFSNRILSRDECFDPTSKKANLKALFPCGDNMVCIIDDREDVWSNALNLIHVKPYHFFQHTGDINAPPGLDKHENDNKLGVDLSCIKEATSEANKNDSNCNDSNIHPPSETGTQPDSIPTEKLNNTNGDSQKNDIESEGKLGEEGTEQETNNVEKAPNSKEETLSSKEETPNSKEETLSSKEETLSSKEETLSSKEETPNSKEETPNSKSEEKPVKTTDEDEINQNQPIADTVIEPQALILPDDSPINQDQPIADSIVEPQALVHPEDNLIEINDPDDYLAHLEDILKRIHSTFYEAYDKMESGDVPDLKKVIPMVRGRVLQDCRLVFSGLVPTHVDLEQAKAYQIARNLGAEVTQELEEGSTHLVAVRPGTAKVNAGRRRKGLQIVTPDWLWSCAERWERVSEETFVLSSKGSRNRHPPPHCSSPEHATGYPEHSTPAMRKRTPSGRFMDTINPLMSFSSADIADMDKEVADILDDESDESSDEEKPKAEEAEPVLMELNESSSSSESPTKGLKRKHAEIGANQETVDLNSGGEGGPPRVKFRRGEQAEDELDLGQESQDSEDGSVEAPDEEADDGEWNMMGAALEREFLSNN